MTRRTKAAGRPLGVAGRLVCVLAAAGTVAAFAPRPVAAQVQIQTQSERVISIGIGSTAIVTLPRSDSIARVSFTNPDIADAPEGLITANQVVINAINVGSTGLVIWDQFLNPTIYTIEVTADVASLQRQIDELFPDQGIEVSSTGTSGIVLSGEVRDPSIQRKVLELAGTTGITVVNNLQAPAPEQILLHVEFAEVARSVLKELGGDLVRILNPRTLDDAFGENDDQQIEALSEGLVTIMVQGENSQLDAVIRLLKNQGQFQSLAQPNLVTREGQEATFLAGGEFPFPTIQGGGGTSDAVTITFREFGIRLNFLPTITNSGNIRLAVEPEVSSLDFANGLTFSGFQIPSLLVRRVTTDVELRPGQTLAIGGLMDNSITEDVDKIPVLGDIPILGFFFKSQSFRQNRTELLVLVTPYILDPDNLPAPPLPTGDPMNWEWDSHIGRWMQERADSAAARGDSGIGDPTGNGAMTTNSLPVSGGSGGGGGD